jgi:hypothetical protein
MKKPENLRLKIGKTASGARAPVHVNSKNHSMNI